MDLSARFKDDIGYRVVEDFNNLQRTGSLDDCLDKFEELKALLVMKNPLLLDDYFLDCFVGGLKPHLKSFVKAFHPATLYAAIEYARYQEETVEAIKNQDVRTKPSLHSSKGILPTPLKTCHFTYSCDSS